MSNGWSSEQDVRLRYFWEQGASAPAIARLLNEEFGTALTDAAVRGRAHRLGLRERPPGNSLFRVPRQYQQLKVKAADGARLVVLNDVQFPFHDREAVAAVDSFLADFQPTHLVLNGDIYDFYELSDFDKNPTRKFNLQEELDIGAAHIRRWERLTKAEHRYFIDGNHEDRLRRWLWRFGAQVSSLRTLEAEKLLGIEEGWTRLSYGSCIDFMGVLIEHGNLVSQAAGATALRMLRTRGSSGISGHSHRFADVWQRDARRVLRWIENGCLCSLEPEYTARPNWQHAFTYGIVKDGRLWLTGVPILDASFRAEGRWYHA